MLRSNPDEIIRKLAKRNKYQTIFSLSKEGSITLFKNKFEYTDIQITFLNYLLFYSNLYTDIAMDYVDQRVLENNEYEDAYSYYKLKTRGNLNKNTQPIPANSAKKQSKGKDSMVSNSTWVFKSKTKTG